MLKKKTSSRLLGLMISVSLLLNTLLVNLPLNSQPLPGETIQQTVQRERLKIEVKQKIKQIKSINWRLKAAQFAIPGLIAGGGIAVSSVILLNILSQIILLIALITGPKLLLSVEYIHKFVDNIITEIKNTLTEEKLERAKKILKTMTISTIVGATMGILGLLISVLPVSLLASAILAVTGAATAIVKGIFGLSTTSVTRAFDNVKEIERLEKENLITLTPNQKAVIAKLKKRQKSPIIQGIIKNLRLNDIRKKLVRTAMQTNASLVAKLTKKKMSKKKIRKLFAKYIKARWDEKTFQKDADALPDTKEAAKLKASITKGLDKMKKKIEKLDAQHPDLRTTLKKEVDAYSDKANQIREELKKDVMKALDLKELKPQPAPRQAVPL